MSYSPFTKKLLFETKQISSCKSSSKLQSMKVPITTPGWLYRLYNSLLVWCLEVLLSNTALLNISDSQKIISQKLFKLYSNQLLSIQKFQSLYNICTTDTLTSPYVITLHFSVYDSRVLA